MGISQGGTTGVGDVEKFQLVFTPSRPSGNFSKGMGWAQLTEEHGHKIYPNKRTFGHGVRLLPL
jgi:hypothetical protein